MLVNKGNYSRTMLTTSGEFSYSRAMLVPKTKEDADALQSLAGVKSVFPLDCALKVDKVPFKMTRQAMSLISKTAVRSKSYAEAAEILAEGERISISSVQVEKVTDYVGDLMFQKQLEEAREAMAHCHDKIDNRKRRRRADDVLYLEIDGAMVYLRDKENGRPGWTESKHAIAFNSSNIKRFYNAEGQESGHRITKRDYIGYIGHSDEFVFHFLALAGRNECNVCSEIVVISDGAPWIHNIVRDYLPKATYILDLYHAKENAGKFAKYVESNAKKQKEYADSLCGMIEEGDITGLLKELEKYRDEDTPEGVPNLYTYIDNHKDGMDYPSYKKKGYFVGSGAIESANRSIMQNRLKLPGMRWKRKCGQGMLTLKTKYESGNWKDVDEVLTKALG